MTWTAREVDPKENEWDILRHESKPCYASVGYIVVSIGVGISFLLWTVLGWIGGFWSGEIAAILKSAGLLFGITFCVYCVISFLRFDRKRLSAAKEDLARGKLLEIEVKPTAVVKLRLINDNEPILCFQADEGKMLYMQGQYMYDPYIYGQENDRTENCDEEGSVNGMKGEKAFPNDHFKVRLLPRNGRVLSIELLGRSMHHGEEIDALRPEYDFPGCILIDGSIATIHTSLEEAVKETNRTS